MAERLLSVNDVEGFSRDLAALLHYACVLRPVKAKVVTLFSIHSTDWAQTLPG